MGRMYRSMSNYKVYDYNKCEVDQVLVTGKFIGTEENARYGGNDFLIAPENDGPTVKLWGSGHLAWQMNKLDKGANVQVTYLGKEILESGNYKGKPSHQFDVAVAYDDEAEMEAAPQETNSNPAPASEAATTSENSGNVDLSGLD